MRVSPTGGEPTTVATVLQGREAGLMNPWFLPDGRHFLYNATANFQASGLFAGDVESKDRSHNRREVLAGTGMAFYSQGYLLFLRDRTLMAQRFDPGSFETRGEAYPVAEQVDSLFGGLVGGFGASQNGVLAYTSGAFGNAQLTWYESRFTLGPGINASPIWSPDGSHIAYTSVREGHQLVYLKARDGTGEERAVDPQPGSRRPDQKLMAVEIKTNGSTIQPGVPKVLFPVRLAGGSYDVGKDGRFLIPTPVDQSAGVPITVVNWTAGLKK
jgi:WD40-like Beta Propeller Repeat